MTLTLNLDSSDTLDGGATITLRAGVSGPIYCDGTDLRSKAIGQSLVDTQIFTCSGTWTKLPWASRVLIDVVGGRRPWRSRRRARRSSTGWRWGGVGAGAHCGNDRGEMRIVAFITEAMVVRGILAHLDEATSPPRMAPARGGPLLWEMVDAGQDEYDPPA